MIKVYCSFDGSLFGGHIVRIKILGLKFSETETVKNLRVKIISEKENSYIIL